MIHLRTLGQMELVAGDGGVDANALVAQPKRFALLCYLAIPKPGTLIRRDTLLSVFWPEGDIEHSRTALRQALAHIRRVLGDEVIVRRGAEEVAVNSDLFWCDVAAFEQALDECKLAEAIELYGGELLRGFQLSNALEFERWVDGERTRLAGRYANALEELANAAAAAGNVRAEVESWQSLTRHNPFDSRYAMGLMEALGRAGDVADALLHARKHAELLRKELGIGPPREFENLIERLRGEFSATTDAALTHGGPDLYGVAAAAGRDKYQPQIPEPPVSQRKSPKSPRRLGRMVFPLAGIGAIVLAIVVGVWLLKSQRPGESDQRPTVAILNLSNLGPRVDSVFAIGMTDALVTRLAGIRDLRITVGGSGFAEHELDLDLITERLGATHVLTGSFLREHSDDLASTVRISLQLVDAADGTYVWAEAFEATLGGVFDVYRAIGEQVARALNVTLLEEEREALAQRPSRDTRAYEYFLVGNAYFEDAFPINPELWNAVEWYEKAIEADSQFALAYAKLSMAHGGLYWGWHDRSEERLRMQLEAAETALRLQPGLAEGRLAMAIHFYWGHRDYERALETLTSVGDQLETNYWYLNTTAAIHRRMGNFVTAARMFENASNLNPLAFSPAVEAGDTYRSMRQYEKAHRYIDRYIAIRPSRPVTYLRKALAYLEQDGNVERAREVLMSGPAGVSFDEMLAAAARYRCLYHWDRLVRVLCYDCRGAVDRMAPYRRFDDIWHYYFGMALLYNATGEANLARIYHDSTATILETFIRERPPDTHYHADLALAYAALGNKEAALLEATRGVALADTAGDAWAGYSSIRKRAEVYALVGEPDSAVADLDLILSAFAAARTTGRYIDPATYVPLMRIDPIWDSIRDHPGFQELLDRYDSLKSNASNP